MHVNAARGNTAKPEDAYMAASQGAHKLKESWQSKEPPILKKSTEGR